MVNCKATTISFLVLFMSSSIGANRLLGVVLPNEYMQQLEDQQKQILVDDELGGGVGVVEQPPRSAVIGHHFYMDRRSIQNCAGVTGDEETFLSMDRLCEACHEMYRHRDPNTRANCRNNCFDNDDFVFCFNHFAGGVQVSRS